MIVYLYNYVILFNQGNYTCYRDLGRPLPKPTVEQSTNRSNKYM